MDHKNEGEWLIKYSEEGRVKMVRIENELDIKIIKKGWKVVFKYV